MPLRHPVYASLYTLVVYRAVYVSLCTLVVYPGVYARLSKVCRWVSRTRRCPETPPPPTLVYAGRCTWCIYASPYPPLVGTPCPYMARMYTLGTLDR